MTEMILETVNEVLRKAMVKGTNEEKLLSAMERYPKRYDFGDCDVYLEIRIPVGGEDEETGEETWRGEILISRSRGHSYSEPFQFRFRLEGEEWGRDLQYKDGKWVFWDDEF